MRLATRAPLEISAARRRFDRILWLLLALACVAGVIVYAPRLSSAYHAWSLSRLSPTRLEAHVRKHPNDLEARYRLGLSLGRSGKHVEAIRELVAVLQKDPGRADVLNDLGALYLLEGRYYESLVTLRAALEARPEYAVVYANLGRLHVATKMPFTAVKELAHAVHLAPGNVETLCDLGEAYQRTLNYTSARRVYEQVLNKEPRLVRAHVGLGKTLFSLTEYGMAEAALQRALQLAAEEPTALATLGRLKLEQAAEEAEFQTARDLLRRAVRADPADSDAWYDLGRVALRQKKPDQAVPFLERALQLSGRHPGATLQLSQALRLVGRTAEADRWTERLRRDALLTREQSRLEEQLRDRPEDWDAMARLAEIELETGEPGMAALHCRQLVQGSPHHPKLPGLLQELARQTARTQPGSAARSTQTEAVTP